MFDAGIELMITLFLQQAVIHWTKCVKTLVSTGRCKVYLNQSREKHSIQKHKFSQSTFNHTVVGSTPRLAKFGRDLGGFSPEFCMEGEYTKGVVSSFLYLRMSFVVLFIHSDWCTLNVDWKCDWCASISTIRGGWSQNWVIPRTDFNQLLYCNK